MSQLKKFLLFYYFIVSSNLFWELIWGCSKNYIGLIFLFLSFFLSLVSVLCSWQNIKHNHLIYYYLLFILQIILIGLFFSINLLNFYIFFEFSLIPIFLVIVGWGSRSEKLRAAYYLFFFTFISSVFMLLIIIKIYLVIGSLNIYFLQTINLNFNFQKWCFFFFTLAMSVKIPMFPFHIWLPQAHVEAPLAGSVLLAGILLKLGGYGIIFFIIPLFPFGFYYYNSFFQLMSILGIIYGAFSTIRQSDMKRLIAYSSVSHMGFSTYALFSIQSEVGIISSLIILISHGFTSPALFILVGIIYERYGTRILKYYRGLGNFMPVCDYFTLIFILTSIAFPLSFNFIGELLLIITISYVNLLALIFIGFGAFLGLKYSLYFYIRLLKGVTTNYCTPCRDLTKREIIILTSLIIPNISLGLFPSLLILYI